jgi:hypothetical protein
MACFVLYTATLLSEDGTVVAVFSVDWSGEGAPTVSLSTRGCMAQTVHVLPGSVSESPSFECCWASFPDFGLTPVKLVLAYESVLAHSNRRLTAVNVTPASQRQPVFTAFLPTVNLEKHKYVTSVCLFACLLVCLFVCLFVCVCAFMNTLPRCLSIMYW